MVYSDLPLVEPPQKIVCDSKGKKYAMEGHDISLSVPPGALTRDTVVTITTGVLLSGPFVFQMRQDLLPVTPILHLSIVGKERTTFKKPITIIFPHFLDQLGSELPNLAVFFAPYVENAASFELIKSEVGQLEISADCKIVCEIGKETISASSGFLCIAHKFPQKLERCSLRYYLHTLERNDESTHTLHFFMTYALNTFHKVKDIYSELFTLFLCSDKVYRGIEGQGMTDPHFSSRRGEVSPA